MLTEKLILPKIEIAGLDEIIEIELGEGRLTDYGRMLRSLRPIAGAASKSDYAENKVLDHLNGKTSLTMPATVALALCTVVPTDSSTGATITEANYTGYARKAIAAADWNAAASGSASTANVLTFAACTAGSSTVIGYGILDSSTTGAGNMLYWGTATSTVISTTQTPATISAGGLVNTED